MPTSPEDKPRKLRWTDGAIRPTLLPALRRALLIAGLGLSATLSGCAWVVLDAPDSLRREVDPWGVDEGSEQALMARVKARFDPGGVCNRGRFVCGL